MKKFEFRLQSVLDYQEQQKRQAELRCLQTQNALQLAELKATEIENQMIAASAAVSVFERQPTPPDTWSSACRQVERLANWHTNAMSEVKQISERLTEARKRLAEITIKVEALESLRDQQHAEHRAEVAHRDQMAVDEVVMRRWRMQQQMPQPAE